MSFNNILKVLFGLYGVSTCYEVNQNRFVSRYLGSNGINSNGINSNGINSNSNDNIDTNTLSYISISNLIVIGTLVSVLIMIMVFAILINDFNVDTNIKNIKTNNKSDKVGVNKNYSLNKRDCSIFDKNYEDAQRYIIFNKHKRARYNESS